MKSKSARYKISITLPFGPYADLATLRSSQKQMRIKLKQGITFGAPTKSKKGYTCKGTIIIKETANSTVTEIRKTVQAQYPTAKVTVVNLTSRAIADAKWI